MHRLQNGRLGLYILASGFLVLVVSLITAVPALTAQSETMVCGTLDNTTTWHSGGSPYIVTCDVQVANGVTLTIQPNVIVKFDLGTSLQVNGTLIAQDCTFTVNDSTPRAGDWGHIFFATTSEDAVFDNDGNYVSGSKIERCLVEWGGGGAAVNGAVETSSASPFLAENTIRNNGQSGIYAVGRSASQPIVIDGNSISNNSAAGNGGGIYVANGDIIANSVVGNSTAFVSGGNGGGIYATSSNVVDNSVNDNFADANGGGIYATGSTLTDNNVAGNTIDSAFGGGIYATGSTLTGNTVSGNSISNFFAAGGGGIYAESGTIENNTVSGNSIESSTGNVFGGGIYASLGTVANNQVTANTARGDENAYGGGIYAASSSVLNNQVTGNAANASGTHVGYGGGIYADGGSVNSNMVSNNTAAGGSDGQGGGIYGHVSSLSANEVNGNNANLGGGIYAFAGSATGNTILNNTTTLSGALYVEDGIATQNAVRENTAVYGGGLYGQQATLSDNTVEDNLATLAGGGIYASNSTLNGNSVLNNTTQGDGGGLYLNGGAATHNEIKDNAAPSFGHGSGAYLSQVTEFSQNDVINNTATGGTAGGISVTGVSEFHLNNIHSNQPYDAEVVGAEPVDATNNYWGEVVCSDVPAHIYDGDDVPGRGLLTYAPSLYAPVSLAQLAHPLNLTVTAAEDSFTLQWDAIAALPTVGCRPPADHELDVGYRLYYDTDGACTLDGHTLEPGESPIDVGANTSITLTGLSTGEDYSFVVAAYDYLGRKSPFSNAVTIAAPGSELFLPLMRRG